jgi:hypothetical protein
MLDRAWAAACAAGFLVLCVLHRRYIADDAWITVRYAENLASGAGLIFNPARPDVLVLASDEPGRFAARYGVDRALTADRRFAGYTLAHVSSAGCSYSLFAFQSRTTR